MREFCCSSGHSQSLLLQLFNGTNLDQTTLKSSLILSVPRMLLCTKLCFIYIFLSSSVSHSITERLLQMRLLNSNSLLPRFTWTIFDIKDLLPLLTSSFSILIGYKIFLCNISSTRESVSSNFQTPRCEMKKQDAADCFCQQTSKCLEIG